MSAGVWGPSEAAPSVRNLLGLTQVPHPVHVNTLCTGGATSIHTVIQNMRGSGQAVGIALGADDQSLGVLETDNRFRAILAEVTGRPSPRG